ncbi:hypothetical protein J8E27_12465 [Brucella sp. 458]|nr:hypothetical protein J8E27_12465 [Brucella sp. 458]
MWIMLTDVSGDKIAVNFNHVLSYNVYGTGTRLVTLSADLTFFVRESTEEIETRVNRRLNGTLYRRPKSTPPLGCKV